MQSKYLDLFYFFNSFRRCPNQQVFYKADDPHPYCKVECEARTMCGEVQVPEEHLDVS